MRNMLKLQGIAIAAPAVILSACALFSMQIHLFPVQGPIADQKVRTAISGTARSNLISGSVSVALPDGEKLDGPMTQASLTDSTSNELAPVWDSVYGPGYYVAHILGSQYHARVVLKGEKGTTMLLEMNRETRESPLEGVARDGKGNIYKVTS